jgi:hypothetical protein
MSPTFGHGPAGGRLPGTGVRLLRSPALAGTTLRGAR